jgi:hypothetical protein
MKKSIIYILLIFCFVIFWNACFVTIVDYSGQEKFSSRDVFQKSVDFPPGGNFSLSNFDGNIEISGWENEEVEVYADRIIPQPDRPRIQLMHWERQTPKINFDSFENNVIIKTQAPDREGADCIVDYFVSVPHSINLKDILARDGIVSISDIYGDVTVELRSGEINVDNFSGSLNASLVEGVIGASLYDLREQDKINLNVKEGDIILYLQTEVNAQIDGYFPNGEIFSEFGFKKEPSEGRISAQIGEKGASILLTAMNGDIHIRKIK